MKINILGYEYDIVLQDEKYTANTNLGTHWGKELKIYLNDHQVASQLKSTLIHEIIEAVNYHLCLGLPEKTVQRLETGIFSALQNTEIFKYELKPENLNP